MNKKRGPYRKHVEDTEILKEIAEANSTKPYMAIEDAGKVSSLPSYMVADTLTLARETQLLVTMANRVLGRANSPSTDRAVARRVLFEQARKLKKALDLLNWEPRLEVHYAEHSEGLYGLPKGSRPVGAISEENSIRKQGDTPCP